MPRDQTLPGPMDFDRYEVFRGSPEVWLEAVLDIARAHRLPTTDPHVLAEGTNLIVGLGSLVLKVFPPMLRHQYESERLSLATLAGKLATPIPELVVEGERDGWPYLVITRLPGTSGERVWPSLTEHEKERVLEQIGALIREVQAVPPGPLLSLEPAWDAFVPAQLEGCLRRHERLGLPQRYLDGIEALLRESAALVPVGVSPVILTGEYIGENLLLDGARVCGLIDFGDVMTGFGEYDLLGPSTFLCDGRPARVRSLLGGYGAALTTTLRRRLMTLLLLHRFSDLPRQVRVERWQERTATLQELEELIWPL